MHNRHMHRHHPGPIHFLVRLMVVALIFGAIVNMNSRHDRSSYWQGFRDGTQATAAQSAESDAPLSTFPPSPQNWSGHRAGGPGWGALLFIPLCGLALFGFMGFLFVISRAGRGPRRDWGRGPWGGSWCDDGATKGRQVDDDEIGPEKDPNDYL